MPGRYDIAIVGSGIAGSTLALILGRARHRVVVIEKGRHPRFVIGESTVPTTTLTMRQLARRYGVPEIEDVSHYLGLKKHGLTGFPKRLFWFGVHRPGIELEPRDEVVLDTFPLPLGPDVYILRSDVDGFLASRFTHYGVDCLDNTTVVDHQRDGNRSALLVKTPGGDQTITARFVIDASGHASFFAQLHNLRDEPPRLHTNTRTVFGHFRGVRPLDEALRHRPHPFRFQRGGGTLREDNFAPERFRPLERAFFKEVELVDLAVSGMIASFRDAELFRQYWRIWVHASGLQYFAKAAARPERTTGFPLVYGAGIDSWVSAVREMHRIVMDRDLPAEDAVARTKTVMDGVPHPFRLGRYAPYTGRPLYIHTKMDKFKVLWWLVRYLTRPELRPLGRSRGLVATLFDALGYGPAQVRFGVKYFLSRLGSSEYHHRVDDIRKLDADSGQQLAPVDAPEPRVPVEMPGLRFDPASATPQGPHVRPSETVAGKTAAPTTRQSDQR